MSFDNYLIKNLRHRRAHIQNKTNAILMYCSSRIGLQIQKAEKSEIARRCHEHLEITDRQPVNSSPAALRSLFLRKLPINLYLSSSAQYLRFCRGSRSTRFTHK